MIKVNLDNGVIPVIYDINTAPLNIPLRVYDTSNTSYLSVGDIITIVNTQGDCRYILLQTNNRRGQKDSLLHSPTYTVTFVVPDKSENIEMVIKND